MRLDDVIPEFSYDHNTTDAINNGNVVPIVRHASPDDPFFIPAVYDEPQSVSVESWRDKAFMDLRNWLKASSNKQKTVETWAAVYISCGACYRGFMAWAAGCKIGPEDDLPKWLEAAQRIVTEKRWI